MLVWRHSVGERPFTFLKVRLKADSERKPTRSPIGDYMSERLGLSHQVHNPDRQGHVKNGRDNPGNCVVTHDAEITVDRRSFAARSKLPAGA